MKVPHEYMSYSTSHQTKPIQLYHPTRNIYSNMVVKEGPAGIGGELRNESGKVLCLFSKGIRSKGFQWSLGFRNLGGVEDLFPLIQ